MSDILNFWEYKKNNDLTVNQLKKAAREYYTEDFIEESGKWKANLKDINELMQNNLRKYVTNINEWEDMSFDYFCRTVNNEIESWIDTNEDIKPIDITNITEKIVTDYTKLQYDELNKKKYTLANLIISIKKPLVDFRD